MGGQRPYPPEARQAVEGLLFGTSLSMRAIADRTGVPYSTVRQWNAGLPTRARADGRTTIPSLATLNAALRAHLTRRIVLHDQALADPNATLDSSKALHDLAGMKRLLDALAAEAGDVPARRTARETGRGSNAESGPARPVRIDLDGEADGVSPQDIAELRADLARRYAARGADGADQAPGDAETGAVDGAGPGGPADGASALPR